MAIAQNQALQIASSVGGFAENSSLSYSTQQIPTAAITLRVPAQFFGMVLQRVESLGKVTSNNVTGQDVTAQVADTDARVKELGAEEDDYVTMLPAQGPSARSLRSRTDSARCARIWTASNRKKTR